MPRESHAQMLFRWERHPAQMVRELFGVEPDLWQEEALEVFPTSPRLAMRACKGPGKTCVLAWIAWNFLLTRRDCKIMATSATADTLADTLWPEMSKWLNKAPLLQEMFVWQKTQIFCKLNPAEWFMAARSWSRSASIEQQADTLAGRHADYILFLIDESGGIPDAVMVAAEAAFAGTKECHIVQAGNPTHRSGPLYRASTAARHLWRLVTITGDPDDPKRSPRIPVEYAREQIQQYGRDNPWVLVNIFGEFPPSSINTLIGPEECERAQARHYREYEFAHAPRIISADVARFGDDATVIARRQGLQTWPMVALRGASTMQVAGRMVREWEDWHADGCFIDETGGYGAGVIDAMRQLGRAPLGVIYSGEPHDRRYYNKRAEIYFDLVSWIKAGGALPQHPELIAALTQTTYSFKGERLLLEPKEMVKLRLGYSPDHADALAQTFAEKVAVRPKNVLPGRKGRRDLVGGYDPFAEVNGEIM